MNKFTYFLLFLLSFLPLGISAQEDITIIVNDESKTVRGTVVTISDTEEYIDTETSLYQVTGKNLNLLGDVVKDFVINIHDITATIDMILNNEFTVVADINEDGSLNINDIITLVDTALGVEEMKSFVESYEVEDITNVWIKSSTASTIDQN